MWSADWNKLVSESGVAYVTPKEEGPIILTTRDIREMAMEKQKYDKVSSLLGRGHKHKKGQEADFSEINALEAKCAKAVSSTRYHHSKESIAGGDARDTRFSRKRDRLTEFMEVYMAQTFMMRK